jgi:hypothetical protein
MVGPPCNLVDPKTTEGRMNRPSWVWDISAPGGAGQSDLGSSKPEFEAARAAILHACKIRPEPSRGQAGEGILHACKIDGAFTGRPP